MQRLWGSRALGVMEEQQKAQWLGHGSEGESGNRAGSLRWERSTINKVPQQSQRPEFLSKPRGLARRVNVGPNTQKGCSFWEEWQQWQVLRDSGTRATVTRKIRIGRGPKELSSPGNSPVQWAGSQV